MFWNKLTLYLRKISGHPQDQMKFFIIPRCHLCKYATYLSLLFPNQTIESAFKTFSVLISSDNSYNPHIQTSFEKDLSSTSLKGGKPFGDQKVGGLSLL
jgi:hypothetical protein